MKKKLLAFALVACMAVIAIAGASLAYFTDEEKADNVFVMKGVDIVLNENFEQGSELVPALKINKDVWVSNESHSTNAYVRVHIAIPAVLDDGDPSFAAVNNFLHFNMDKASFADGMWSWNKTADGANYPGTGSDEWNFYTTEVDGIAYNVYVVTYESILAPGASTLQYAISQVYVDKSVDATWDAEKGQYVYVDTLGNEVTPDQFADADGKLQIKIIAEAAQAETFANAFEALDTAFGVPGTYDPYNK
jgi:predicted ribosomally synthesized peptide with SipW-like signal peptide